jgi:predicted nuclease of predicted toxin-antitoxin system
MLRLLIDENLNHHILRGLKSRIPQLDYVVVRQIGMSGYPDLELLHWAATQDRIIVTHDKKTMTKYANYCLKSGERMAGVIIIPNDLEIGRAVDDLQLLVECYSRSELTDKIEYVPLKS